MLNIAFCEWRWDQVYENTMHHRVWVRKISFSVLLYSCLFACLIFFFLTFIYFWERETETEHGQGRGRERGRQRIRSRLQDLSCQHRAQCGVQPTNREIMTWVEVGHLTDWATLVSLIYFFNVYSFLRECERGRSRERGRQNLKYTPGSELSAQSLTWGSNSWKVRSWPELKSDA